MMFANVPPLVLLAPVQLDEIMARFLKTSLPFLCMLVFVVTEARAEKRVALLIGNSAYQYTTPLPNPANDVQLLAGVFRQLGFEVLEYQNAGYIGLKKAIRNFTSKLNEYGPDTVGFVFYAGHGLQVGGIKLSGAGGRGNRERSRYFPLFR